MTFLIHPSSSISKSVKLGKNVKIGPYCNVDGNITIGDNTELKSHVSITGNTTIGKNNTFYPGLKPKILYAKNKNFNKDFSYLVTALDGVISIRNKLHKNKIHKIISI